VEELKQTIITEWKNLSQRFIDSCINEWRRRLECVVKNGGGNIEHCNFLESWLYYSFFVAVDWTVNEQVSLFLAVVFVLLGSVATELK